MKLALFAVFTLFSAAQATRSLESVMGKGAYFNRGGKGGTISYMHNRGYPGSAHEILTLEDTSRPDPYSNATTRRFMATAWSWTTRGWCRAAVAPYLPAETHAEYEGVFQKYGLPHQFLQHSMSSFCDACQIWFDSNPQVFPRKLPVVVFSPSFGMSRLMYTGMGRWLARRGFVVFILDSPGETNIVEFEDGEFIRGHDPTEDYSDDIDFHIEVCSPHSLHRAVCFTDQT